MPLAALTMPRISITKSPNDIRVNSRVKNPRPSAQRIVPSADATKLQMIATMINVNPCLRWNLTNGSFLASVKNGMRIKGPRYAKIAMLLFPERSIGCWLWASGVGIGGGMGCDSGGVG